MLDDGIVAAPLDIDLCLILGRGLAVPPGRDHPVPGPHRPPGQVKLLRRVRA